MHFLRLTDTADLRAVPPFGILEPLPTYPDGTPREDVYDMHDALDLVGGYVGVSRWKG
jgi:hypothetical protein